jgi:hypothetical protein
MTWADVIFTRKLTDGSGAFSVPSRHTFDSLIKRSRACCELHPWQESLAGCWTGRRLDNAGVMVSLMLPGVSDDVFADVYKIVMIEKRRRTAAAA